MRTLVNRRAGGKLRKEGTISVVGASDTNYTTGTSISIAYPSGIQAGDLLVTVVMHRSALTLPSGWTLAGTQVTGGLDLVQYTTIIHKVATGTESGTNQTIAQAASGRLAFCTICIRSTTGNFAVTDIKQAADVSSVPPTPTIPNTQISRVGGIFIAGSSHISALVAPNNTTHTASTGWTLYSATSKVDNRIGAAYRIATADAIVTGTLPHEAIGVGTADPWSLVSIAVEPS